MPLNKHSFNDDEEPIFDEAVIYKRAEYWQMRMWLAKEGKYARFSLKTRNKSTAIDKANIGIDHGFRFRCAIISKCTDWSRTGPSSWSTFSSAGPRMPSTPISISSAMA